VSAPLLNSITECRNEIRLLDKQIDANRSELLSRCTRKPKHWLTWGHAWARNPDLAERDRELFRRRGEVQEVLNSLEARSASAKAAAQTRRSLARKMPKCPTCHGSGLAVAA
jgi:hypothetical protein